MKKLVLGVCLGVASLTAHAESALASLMENLYGGLSFGPAHLNEACTNDAIDCQNTQSPGYKWVGGWRMSERIGGEIAYINFERAVGTYRRPADGQPFTRAFRTDGFLFNVALFQPLTQDVTGVVRIGLARLHTFATETSPTGVVTEIGRTQGDTSPYLGLAVNLDIRDLMSRFMPVELEGMYLEAGVDMTRARFGGRERPVRLWSVGGGFQF